MTGRQTVTAVGNVQRLRGAPSGGSGIGAKQGSLSAQESTLTLFANCRHCDSSQDEGSQERGREGKKASEAATAVAISSSVRGAAEPFKQAIRTDSHIASGIGSFNWSAHQ